MTNFVRKPEWLKTKITSAYDISNMKSRLNNARLHTICESGSCPNKAECWADNTASFMILGDICTRSCAFCNVKTGTPMPPDVSEAENLSLTISDMQLKHTVITSVDRDDLPDGGAEIWKKCIQAIKKHNPKTNIEVLIPDFQAKPDALEKIAEAKPDIIAHNLETVERLTGIIRKKNIYKRSLGVLSFFSDKNFVTKSGIMAGLGETEEEIFQAMNDLLDAGVSILTLGQYLQPSKKHIEVSQYIHPDTFLRWKDIGLSKGFKYVESGVFVRSSYHAAKHL